MKVGISHISGGELGTDQTVKAMRSLVQRSLLRPDVRLFTLGIFRVGNVSSKNESHAAHVIFDYIQKNISYVKDPIDIEVIQEPVITLKLKAGDCDDHAVLVASMFESVGVPSRFVVVGRDVQNFQHIYTQVLIKNRWLAVDTTLDKPLGSLVKMPQNKIYDNKGTVMNNRLSHSPRNVILSGVDKQNLASIAYAKTTEMLNREWNAGRISINDLHNYLKTIKSGTSPAPGDFIEKPFMDAVAAMIRSKQAAGYRYNSAHGLSGDLAGIFDDIWNGVKGTVTNTVKSFKLPTGGGTTSGQAQPLINIPAGLIQTNVSPQAAQAAAAESMSEILKNPFVIAAGVAVVTLLVQKVFK